MCAFSQDLIKFQMPYLRPNQLCGMLYLPAITIFHINSNGYSHTVPPSISFLEFLYLAVICWEQLISLVMFYPSLLSPDKCYTIPTFSQILSLEHSFILYFACLAGNYLVGLLLNINLHYIKLSYSNIPILHIYPHTHRYTDVQIFSSLLTSVPPLSSSVAPAFVL